MVLMKILMRTLPKVPSLAPCDDTVVDDADDADDDGDDDGATWITGKAAVASLERSLGWKVEAAFYQYHDHDNHDDDEENHSNGIHTL